jgi:hypothetical protein
MVRIASAKEEAKYEEIKQKVRDMILARYPGTKPEEIEFFQGKEGLWITIDPTGAKSFAPGVRPFRTQIVDQQYFGTTNHDMGLN